MLRFSLLFILLLPLTLYSQECDHTSDSFARFENIRHYPPAKIIKIYPETKQLEISVSSTKDKLVRIITDLVYDSNTIFKDGVESDPKGYWWIQYCAKCRHVLAIYKVRSDQIKYERTIPRKPLYLRKA